MKVGTYWILKISVEIIFSHKPKSDIFLETNQIMRRFFMDRDVSKTHRGRVSANLAAMWANSSLKIRRIQLLDRHIKKVGVRRTTSNSICPQ